MAQLYVAGETKVRPGVYYRYSGDRTAAVPGAMNGINAIVLAASWGPTGIVTTHETLSSITETYGSGAGVDAALAIKEGGATTVYICRPAGTGGVAGSAELSTIGTVNAKYVGARALALKIQVKPGDATVKEAIILDGTKQLEKFEFAVNESDETAALTEALAGSAYVTANLGTPGVAAEGEYKLTGGVDPTITPQDYLDGFKLLEPYRYNVLSTDSIDPAVNAIVCAYADEAEQAGKLIMAVIGDASTTAFGDRKTAAAACNDKKIIYLGNGFVTAAVATENAVKAINYTAGVISSTPANQSIVHSVVSGATDVTEKLTNSQYVEAIKSGMLLFSVSPEGQVWYDSGVNTLITPADNEDDGWKKIKRTKIRFELFDRIDRAVAPLVGKVNCDPDGVAAVIQSAMGVITTMIAENKLRPGATMVEDPERPHFGDSAWFVIQADDIDSLEKIYLHYQFRYSHNA